MMDTDYPSIGESLVQFFSAVGRLLNERRGLALPAFLLLVWIVWWLWAVRWEKAWPVLAKGAWAPLVLLAVAVALVWSQMAPSDCTCLGLIVVPNFWWQLGGVGLLLALMFFCGWLQGVLNWAPADVEIELDSSAVDATHGHEHPVGTLHGHDEAHAAH